MVLRLKIKIKYVVVLFWCIFLNMHGIYAQKSLGTPDSAIIRYELNRLNHLFGFRTSLKITPSGFISSLPSEMITFSLAELNKIASVKDENIRLYVIRYIVAHEFAHQLQFYRYKVDSVYLSNDLMSRTLIEAQADILAGFYFFNLSDEFFPYIQEKPQLIKSLLTEIFQTIYSLGIVENTVGTHPSKHDRLLAARLGMQNGFSYNLDVFIKQMVQQGYQFDFSAEEYKKTFDEQFRFLDLQKNEDPLVWSYRQARKIVNYDRRVANDIVLITPPNKRFTFDTSSSNPFCRYNLEYQNIGTKSIYVEMEVYINHVKRNDPGSAVFYRKINVNHYKFTLEPAQTISIKDSLLWLSNSNDTTGITTLTDDFMPSIVFPGSNNNDAMISCTYSNNSSNLVHGKQIQYLKFREEDSYSNRFSIFINTLINAIRLNPSQIITGIGSINGRNKDVISYLSSLQYGEESETLILIDKNKKTVSADILFPNFYPESYKVKETYELLKKSLKKELKRHNMKDYEHQGNLTTAFTSKEYDLYLDTVQKDLGSTKVHTIIISVFFH